MIAALASLLACPYCFGDASSDMVRGAKVGVAFLLVVVAGVLVAIAGIARSWARRARELDAAASASAAPASPGFAAPAGLRAGFLQSAIENSEGTISPALPSRTSSNA